MKKIEVFQCEFGMFRDEPGVLQDEMGFVRCEPGAFRDESGVFRDESGVFRDEFGVFRDGFGVFRDGFGVFRGELGAFRDEFGAFRDEFGAFRDEGDKAKKPSKQVILNTFKGRRFLQGENRRARKMSQYLKSSIGKGLTLGNVLKFYFGMVSHRDAKDTQLFGHEWHECHE